MNKKDTPPVRFDFKTYKATNKICVIPVIQIHKLSDDDIQELPRTNNRDLFKKMANPLLNVRRYSFKGFIRYDKLILGCNNVHKPHKNNPLRLVNHSIDKGIIKKINKQSTRLFENTTFQFWKNLLSENPEPRQSPLRLKKEVTITMLASFIDELIKKEYITASAYRTTLEKMKAFTYYDVKENKYKIVTSKQIKNGQNNYKNKSHARPPLIITKN